VIKLWRNQRVKPASRLKILIEVLKSWAYYASGHAVVDTGWVCCAGSDTTKPYCHSDSCSAKQRDKSRVPGAKCGSQSLNLKDVATATKGRKHGRINSELLQYGHCGPRTAPFDG
jgi:hypothetical protein